MLALQAISPQLIALICAELYVLLLRSRQVTVLVKSKEQRTAAEQKEIDRGLVRSLLLELLVFVPASTLLVLVIFPPFVEKLQSPYWQRSIYGALGIASYGFPFVTIRHIVTRIALKTLAEFSALAQKEGGKEDVTGKHA